MIDEKNIKVFDQSFDQTSESTALKIDSCLETMVDELVFSVSDDGSLYFSDLK